MFKAGYIYNHTQINNEYFYLLYIYLSFLPLVLMERILCRPHVKLCMLSGVRPLCQSLPYIEADHDSSPLSFQDSDLLTFNISAHHSWWSEHGPGCVRREIPASGERGADTQSYISIMGCLLEYQYIEVLHSSFQILISVSRSKTHTQTNDMPRHVEKLKHSISSPSVAQKPCFYCSLWSTHTIFTLTICVYLLLLYIA